MQDRLSVTAFESKPMKHRFPVVHPRLHAATGQNVKQQTGNYPTSKLMERGVEWVFFQPASYPYQAPLIMLDGKRGVIESAQIIGELTTNDPNIFRKSLS
jgi:hypothetical protein